MRTRKQKTCGVCGSLRLTQVIDLPNLPLTGIYIKSGQSRKDKGIHQGWQLCRNCGHGQLREVVPGEILYGESYGHRGGASPLARRGIDYFVENLEKVTLKKKYKRVLDVGCNDGYLLKQLEQRSDKLAGIDPIWAGQDHDLTSKIMIRGGRADEAEKCLADLGGAPDLITTTHVWEHIENPGAVLDRLMTIADDNTMFVFEVPSFDSLLKLCRFDQIFHQHINYFSLASFLWMIEEAGGKYIDHTHNWGLWGGSLIVAFRKKGPSKKTSFIKPSLLQVKKRYELFRRQMEIFRGVIDGAGEPLYGFGAAQILPVLAYHLQSDLGFLESILDDVKDRQGCRYIGIKPAIEAPARKGGYGHAGAVITALDSSRDAISRCRELGFRHIFSPLNII